MQIAGSWGPHIWHLGVFLQHNTHLEHRQNRDAVDLKFQSNLKLLYKYSFFDQQKLTLRVGGTFSGTT